MGLDQEIIRTTGNIPVHNEQGEVEQGTLCLELRKEYWLRNAIAEILYEKTGEKLEDHTGEYIPLTREEIQGIIDKAKECIQEKRESFTMETFNTGLFYSNHDHDWCLEGMRIFNRVMSNRLRSKKETQYYYIEWY